MAEEAARERPKRAEEIGRRLARSSLFAGLEDAAIAKLAAGADLRTLETGEIVLKQGDYGDSLFLLDEGSLAVTATDEAGRTRTVATLAVDAADPPPVENVIGELCLLDLEPRCATVTATAPSTLVELHRDELYWLFGEDRALQLHVIVAIARILSRRLRVDRSEAASPAG